jgi:hypothetical protein
MAKNPGIHIKQWHSGLRTNRAATSTPIRPTLGGAIPLNDTLWDGLNMEITPANTLARRPGWVKYCSTSYSTDVPKGFAGAVLNGNLFRLLDTDKKVYVFDTTSLTSILTKAANSSQSYFKQVGNVLFFSDGAENKKWTGYTDTTSLTLATPTNNGIVAPVNAPTIANLNLYDTVGTAQTTHAWIAGYKYTNTTSAAQNYFFLAPTGEIQWAVVARGTTLTSSKAAPNWAANYGVFGARTNDGQMEWTNCGPIGVWAAGTAFTNAGYVATHPLSATSTQATMSTSGSTNFNWLTTVSTNNPSGTAAGFYENTPNTGNTNTLLIKALGFNVPAGATIKGIEVDVYRGALRSNAVTDVTVQLLKAGVAAGSNKATGGFWPFIPPPTVQVGSFQFNVDYRVPGTGGIEQVYGGPTDMWGTSWTPTDINDAGFGIQIVANQASTNLTTGAITFANGGNAQTPVNFIVHYIAAASDISGTVYAQIIVDSNNNLQRVKTAGTSGGSAPTWSTTIGGTTADGGITWECLGTANQLPVLFNWSYAYGYHTADNGSEHISTMSPLLTVSGPIIGTGVTLGGTGSSDTTQCDRADLYRTPDGGSLLLYNTSTPNVNGAVSWTDVATDQDLNFAVIGPVADANDPPPSGMTMLEYHMGRLWGVVGTSLFFSAGPDCINGDGSQAWPPANEFQFDSAVTGITATSLGLVVETADGMHIILGGPQTQTFWVRDLNSDRGVLTQNCLAQDGDRLIMYTSNRQLFMMDPSNEEEIGFPVSPTLASTFAPLTTSIVTHRSGQDQGIFLSDGSTTTMRYNLSAQSWDVLATPVGGIGPLASIQTALGTKTLLSTSNGFIVARTPTTFQDSGSSYSAFATVGSLTLSEAGQDAAHVESVLVTSAAVGSALTVSVLPNEISGSFTALGTAVNDPWRLPASSTLNMKRYDWNTVATPLANEIRHIQIKVTLPTEAAKNEVYTLGLV